MVKNTLAAILLSFACGCIDTVGCGTGGYVTVQPRHLAVMVKLLGDDKGVQTRVLGPGRYYVEPREELHDFPASEVNYPWTKSASEGRNSDESFTFQTKDGMDVNADFGIRFHIDQDQAVKIFQRFSDLDVIEHTYLRNVVRDSLNKRASTLTVEAVYGEGKALLVKGVEDDVKAATKDSGLVVNALYTIGSFRLPEIIQQAITAKVNATQLAQQKENELRQTEAEGKKLVVQARAEAEKRRVSAESEAAANKAMAASFSPQLLEWRKLEVQAKMYEKWDGQLSKVQGSGNSPIVLGNLSGIDK